jgi:hypothetical protein
VDPHIGPQQDSVHTNVIFFRFIILFVVGVTAFTVFHVHSNKKNSIPMTISFGSLQDHNANNVSIPDDKVEFVLH